MRLQYLLLPLLTTAVKAVDAEELNSALHMKRHGGHGGNEAEEAAEAALNDRLARLSILCGGCVLAFFLLWNAGLRFQAHIRRLTNLTNASQRYWIPSDPYWAWLKKNVIYAPLFRARHNREFRLSSAVNMGTLPSRFQAALLTGIITMNVILCCITIPFEKEESDVLGMIISRSGTMAVVNLMPLIVIAGRNNPLIKLLDVSFDTWNLLHRWFGRIVVLETLAHVIAWIVNKVHTQGWKAVAASFRNSQFIYTGLMAAVAFVVLVLHSPSAVRHAFYETFLHLHIALVILAFAGLWIHLARHPQRRFLTSAIVLWAAERAVRFARIIYYNCGNGGTTAVVEALPGEAMRITLRLARPWHFKPGQHLYLYMPTVGLWTSHPFTVVWSDTEDYLSEEKGLALSRQDVLGCRRKTVSLVVRRRTGFTNTLFERAQESFNNRITLSALVEGPYGNEHVLDSYGTVVLIAAGVGITHLVPYVRQLVEGYAQGTVAARRVTLVWIIQAPEHLEWIRPWMTSILSMERRREVLRIMLFITRPRNTKEIKSPSATVQMFPGKPDIPTILDSEIENQIGAMGVMVCGAGSLSDDVRLACRQRQSPTHVDFVEECFTW
ncbi:hypothetical protein VTO42DRAFT_8940 [Malbranchea cinnamomea]